MESLDESQGRLEDMKDDGPTRGPKCFWKKHGYIIKGDTNDTTYCKTWETDLITLPETNSSPLSIDGWKTILSFWDAIFSGAVLVSGRLGSTIFCPFIMSIQYNPGRNA